MDQKKWMGALIVVLLLMLIAQYFYFSNENRTLRAEMIKTQRMITQHSTNNPPALSQRAIALGQDPLDAFMTLPIASQSWDPFEEMERIQSRMNRLFRDSFHRGMLITDHHRAEGSGFNPDLDVQDKDKLYVVKADLPGMDKNTINVEVKNGYLVIAGERKAEHEESSKDGFYRIERSFGSFSQALPLPRDADETRISAEYNNGVLTVTVPKLEREKTAPPASKVTIQ